MKHEQYTTTAIVTPCLQLAGFGPVHAEGFGVGYADDCDYDVLQMCNSLLQVQY